MGDSYPRPLSGYTFNRLNPQPRDILPIFPPPEPLTLPALPSPCRLKPSFDAPYRLSTHLVPSAYLRMSRDVPVPPMPDVQADEERIEQTFQTLRDNSSSSGITDGHHRVLWNCVNRYVRQGLAEPSSTGITLFFAQGASYPKEVWEPNLGYLLSSQDVVSLVDEIWTWETVQQGDAGVVNAPFLPGSADWNDHARDIINFMTNFIPTSPESDALLPTHLPRIPSNETKARLQHGFHTRRIVVIGHSLGGCLGALAVCISPALFASLVLVDPLIMEPNTLEDQLTALNRLALNTLHERERWSSRAEALNFLQDSHSNWDPAILDLYVHHGTYDTTDPTTGQPIVRLKMTVVQQCITFLCDHLTPQETFERLRTLDARVRLRWIVAGRLTLGDWQKWMKSQKRRVWVRAKNASNVELEGVGHLIPMDAPKVLAREIRQHLFGLFGRSLRSNL